MGGSFHAGVPNRISRDCRRAEFEIQERQVDVGMRLELLVQPRLSAYTDCSEVVVLRAQRNLMVCFTETIEPHLSMAGRTRFSISNYFALDATFESMRRMSWYGRVKTAD